MSITTYQLTLVTESEKKNRNYSCLCFVKRKKETKKSNKQQEVKEVQTNSRLIEKTECSND